MASGIQVRFETNHFAEGRFRKAYRGIYENPPNKRGNRAVVKRNKECCIWNPRDFNITVNMSKEAQRFAQVFNSLSRTTCPLTFTDINVISFTNHPDFQLYESFTVEDYIPGTFQKWCNNFGFISSAAKNTDPSMPAFMHWSWYKTRGEKMVSDLQGARCTDPNHPGYILTDPAFLSYNHKYGPTDMGVEGMTMFFLHHECNSLCQGIPKPTPGDFVGVIPKEKLSAAMLQLQGIGNATSYTNEFEFSPRVKQVIIDVFRRVACSI